MLAEVAATGATALPIGTMIELPRAALTAGEIAEAAEFFSFGTNDLTQTTGASPATTSRRRSSPPTWSKGIFGVSPFETIDRDGVGALVEMAVEEGRATRPDLELGVCGEHGGDPDSIHFFHEWGWTTCPARRSESRWRGWRPGAPHWARNTRAAEPPPAPQLIIVCLLEDSPTTARRRARGR